MNEVLKLDFSLLHQSKIESILTFAESIKNDIHVIIELKHKLQTTDYECNSFEQFKFNLIFSEQQKYALAHENQQHRRS
jgi:hypothetical protein